MMTYNPYSTEHTDSALAFIELILPDIDSLEQAFLAFQDTLEDWDDEAAPITAAVLAALDGEGAFTAANDDPDAYITALDALAERWGAGLMYGSNDPDGEFTHNNTVPALLQAAAVELSDYGLTLWLYVPDNERTQGFIARADDDSLIQKLAAATGTELTAAARLPDSSGLYQ